MHPLVQATTMENMLAQNIVHDVAAVDRGHANSTIVVVLFVHHVHD